MAADPGIADPEALLRFWFGDEARPRWFDSTPAFDDLLRDRYLTTWKRRATAPSISGRRRRAARWRW
jgi:uncharacterized protein (DUF924 family)